MSFFDEVETTVANTRYLQAVEDSGPVNLKLTPFEELAELEQKLRAELTLETLLTPKTAGYYVFKQFLEAYPGKQGGLRGEHVFRFLCRVDEYREGLSRDRAANAEALTLEFLVPGDRPSEVSPDAIKVEQDGEKKEAGEEGEHKSDPRTADLEDFKKKFGAALENTTCMDDLKMGVREEPPSQALFAPFIAKLSEVMTKEGVLEAFMSLECKEGDPQAGLSEYYQRYVQLVDYAQLPINLNHFRMFRVLGRGAFGAVSAVQKIDTQAIFAMKEMAKRQVKQNSSEWMVINEKKVLQKMNNPFVLSLKYSFHNEENLYLIFEMCTGGDLKFHLRNDDVQKRRFTLERSRFYAAEVLLGLEHIHSFEIVYRDLKPTNILLDSKGHVKISDLGLTIKLRKNKVLRHLAGTAGYWAPEILQKQGTFKTSDYWSFGVMLYEMVTGRRPRCKCTKKTMQWCPYGQTRAMEDNALHEEGVLLLDIDYPEDKITPACEDLLRKLFEPDPAKRLGTNGTDEIKSHPFFEGMDWAKLLAKEIPPPFVPDAHTVNANSIGEVGEANKNKYRKVKLDEADRKHYQDFNYVAREAFQEELMNALAKLDKDPGTMKEEPKEGNFCCCVS